MSETCKYCGAKIYSVFFYVMNRCVWVVGDLHTPANQICPQNLSGSREHTPLTDVIDSGIDNG